MHECPDCGMACHCNGDVDDCDYGFTHFQENCTHYLRPGCDACESPEDAKASDDYNETQELRERSK